MGPPLVLTVKSERQDIRVMAATAGTRDPSPKREPCWLKATQSSERTGDRNKFS